MIKVIFLSFALTLFYPPQDVRVITYSTGKFNTSSYEGLSFWIKDNQKAYIRYARGADTEDLDLTWAGLVTLNDEKGFKAQFPAPDTGCFYVIPKNYLIKVIGRDGKSLRVYTWENEARAGDSTVGCSICANDEKQAMEWLKKYFMK
jgi:hypothetical protein